MTDAYGGAWVQRGMIRVPTIRDHSNGQKSHTPEQTAALLDPIVSALTKLVLPDSGTQPGWLCHCGCLLIGTETSCYACLVWATKDANDASWRHAETLNRKVS